jgi:signal transduction histidine kinase
MNSDLFASSTISIVLAWILAVPLVVQSAITVLSLFKKQPELPWILTAWVALCFVVLSPLRYMIFQLVLASSYIVQSWVAFLSTFYLFVFLIVPLAFSLLFLVCVLMPYFGVAWIIGTERSWLRYVLGAVAAPFAASLGTLLFVFIFPFAAITTHWSRAEDAIGATNGPAYYIFCLFGSSRVLAPVPDYYYTRTPQTIKDYLRCHVAFYYLSDAEQQRFLQLAYPERRNEADDPLGLFTNRPTENQERERKKFLDSFMKGTPAQQ